MRTTHLLVGLLALAPILPATGQTLDVTPNSLAGWTVTGADLSALQSGSSLTLPPGSQLSRLFPSGELSVDVVTQPVVGPTPQDWPILELGPAALVFGRTGNSGQLIVAMAGDAPITLPGSIALDAAGRASQPVAVSLTLAAGTLTVTTTHSSWQFPSTTGGSGTQAIVASAGADFAWRFDTLRVRGAAVGIAASGAGSHSPKGNSRAAADSNAKAAGKGPSGPSTGFLVGALGIPAAASAHAAAPSTGPPTNFELFTPPSVRRGRADALRASLSSKNP